jgi:hypothetical protein
MLDWLLDSRLTVYLIGTIAAVILLALWFRNRRRGWLYGLGVVALLLGVFAVLDLTIDTPKRQIRRKLREMAAAVKKRDTKAIFAHVSDSFTSDDPEPVTKAQFERRVDDLLKNGVVQDLVIWDEKFPDDSGKVEFMAKPKGPGIPNEIGFRVRAVFVRDPDGQWRLKSFEVYEQLRNERFKVPLR